MNRVPPEPFVVVPLPFEVQSGRFYKARLVNHTAAEVSVSITAELDYLVFTLWPLVPQTCWTCNGSEERQKSCERCKGSGKDPEHKVVEHK